MDVGVAASGSRVSPSGEVWARDPRIPPSDLSDSVGSNKSRSRRRSTNSTGQSDNSGQQRPPVRTRNPGNSRDDLSLVSISNGSDVRNSSSRDVIVTPPHGAGMYPPRNRYNVRLPPLSKRQY